MKNNKIISKEIPLKKRPAGLVTEDDFELVDIPVSIYSLTNFE